MPAPLRWRAGLGLLLLTAPAAAQIVTENAGVLSPELIVLRELVGFSASENLDEVRWSQQLSFAPDRAHEFRLTVPYLWREGAFPPSGGGAELDSDERGLGDVSLRLKRALLRTDEVMSSRRWALLLELGAPTGEHEAEVAGTSVPRPLMPGSGDWSFGAGSAWTWIQDRQRFSLEGFYRHRTRHDGVQLGATAELNAAYWYRFQPPAFAPDESGREVRGVLELLCSHSFASEVGGDTQDDDGTILWLAPGIHVYPWTHLLFEANVQVPLLQDIDDALGERRWSANLILKFLF